MIVTSNILEIVIHTNDDIAIVDKDSIPNHNLLVAGFPCQDYSVAHTLNTAKGIEGKKGVLWWQIYDTLLSKKPKFCLFENVDRLLKSPAKQRGRDFGVMLTCLNQLNYSVEWRVINAAQDGAAQRRRRVFIFAYDNDTVYGKTKSKLSAEDIITSEGIFAKAFPILNNEAIEEISIPDSVEDVSDYFSFPFKNSGYMSNGIIYTTKIEEREEEPICLRDIVENNVDDSFFISQDKLDKWTYLKGSKKIKRTSKSGHEYYFSEGSMAFPDPLDKPARTMLTSESTLNRSTHVISDLDSGKLRLLTPVEAERLQGFNDNWTNTGMPQRMRYFCMGNALVIPIVTRIGKIIDEIFESEI